MAFTKLTKDMNIIQKLDDEPNDVGGLTAAELKAKFDEPANAVKDWINNTFIPEAEETLRLAQRESVPAHASRHASGGADPIAPSMIALLGTNILGGNSDTPNKWVGKGVGYATYHSSVLTDQPSTWGILINHPSGSGIHQKWLNLNTGEISYRAGNTANGWTTTWKKLTTTDYAVNKTGDTMTGSLRVETSSYPTISAYNTTPGRYASVTMGDVGQAVFTNGTTGDSNNRNCLIMREETADLKNMLTLYPIVDGKGTGYSVLHAGNKPSGSYTGNGDAAQRTIDTGGIGSAVLIRHSGGMALVGPQGGFGYMFGDSNITSAAMYFSYGVITLATNSDLVNASGITYHYQVL